MSYHEDIMPIINSIAGKKTMDLYPYGFFINFPFIETMTNVNLEEYFSDPYVMMHAQIETYEKLDLDYPLAADFGVVSECSGYQSEVVFDDHHYISNKKAPFNSIEELLKLPIAEPFSDNYMHKALEFMEYMKKHAPSKWKLRPTLIIGPFTAAANIRGISEICLDVFDYPELVDLFLQNIIKTQHMFINEQKKILKDLKFLIVSDDVSSFLNKDLFSEIILPSYQRLFEPYPNINKILHNDGSANHLTDLIPLAGFELWHLGTDVDLQKAIKHAGNMCLMGGIDPLHELRNMDVSELEQRVRNILIEFQDNPRVILSASGFVNAGTPIENMERVLAIARNK